LTTKTIAYIRVSTDKQADKGVSLEAQEDKARAYAGLYDLELVEVIVDAGESAKTLNRPGLQRALSMLKTGQAEALLVVKLDRLTRSVKDLGTLIETYFTPGKAALMSVGEQIDTRSAAGRLVLNILASVSQWEREIIGERTSVAIKHKQSKGEYIGGYVPYGFAMADGVLVEDAFEQDVIRQAREIQASGLSLRKVSAELNRRGFNARNGQAFQAGQIQRMLAA
jgi:DNA invertase Pin-like site-specific DNA recombinase